MQSRPDAFKAIIALLTYLATENVVQEVECYLYNVLCKHNTYIPLYNGFYLFPLSRAVNSNRLIFDPSLVNT